jgi:hypothetical protein
MNKNVLGSMIRRTRAKNDRVAIGKLCNFAILRLVTIGFIAALVITSEQQARAYVDPGSGLLFLQMLGASAVGALFFLRQKLRKLFRRGSENAQDQEHATPDLPKEPGNALPSASPREPDRL